MDRIRSIQDLQTAKSQALKQESAAAGCQFQIRVSLGSCSIAAGANETLKAIYDFIDSASLKGVQVRKVGCLGLCALEPVVQVLEADRPPVTYGKVFPSVVQRIFNEHIEKHLVVQEYLVVNI